MIAWACNYAKSTVHYEPLKQNGVSSPSGFEHPSTLRLQNDSRRSLSRHAVLGPVWNYPSKRRA